jgi:chemotaxis methyl-accepting protein methylase
VTIKATSSYLNKASAVSIFKKISSVMSPGAYLLLGNHEEFPIDKVKEITELDRDLNIYRKNEITRSSFGPCPD